MSGLLEVSRRSYRWDTSDVCIKWVFKLAEYTSGSTPHHLPAVYLHETWLVFERCMVIRLTLTNKTLAVSVTNHSLLVCC